MKKSDYLGLPKNKSLFFAKLNSGLPNKSYGIRKKLLLQNIYASFGNEFYISGGYIKVVKRKK